MNGSQESLLNVIFFGLLAGKNFIVICNTIAMSHDISDH